MDSLSNGPLRSASSTELEGFPIDEAISYKTTSPPKVPSLLCLEEVDSNLDDQASLTLAIDELLNASITPKAVPTGGSVESPKPPVSGTIWHISLSLLTHEHI